MDWKNISHEETMSASNAPEIVDETVYESLLAELEKKCNPKNFMVPYDENKVALANELYADISKSADAGENAWQLRSEAIRKLGLYFSTAHLYPSICEKCNPKNFMSPYDPDKVCIANELYAQTIRNAHNIEALEAICQLTEEQLKIKEKENRANITYDDEYSYWSFIIFFF